ncbi:VOC family protein [Rhizobium sp. P38BS-XIX]|uniref:VOC family protein n=1 Tax=Rhizobium sp. P38BS-XIX TaxID=2726740 RepID=UPI0014577F97|nr:VOC family protein [Rhizobium sp. P38BS-XIX]NLR95410.1 VOC family protein [Rhizobium sp. P38BS-XIX]
MRLNQVTVTMPDLDAGWSFYCALGLKPVVDARPRYARFVCPDGDSTFSLHRGEAGGGGTTVYFECDNLDEVVEGLKTAKIAFVSGPADKSWLWREAELFDPGGNRVILYFAGSNRINPPWHVASR